MRANVQAKEKRVSKTCKAKIVHEPSQQRTSGHSRVASLLKVLPRVLGTSGRKSALAAVGRATDKCHTSWQEDVRMRRLLRYPLPVIVF